MFVVPVVMSLVTSFSENRLKHIIKKARKVRKKKPKKKPRPKKTKPRGKSE